ncbi:MAG: ATP-binding protein [Polyangiales bacterium]
MAQSATEPRREDAPGEPGGSSGGQSTEALKRYFEHLFANSRDMMNLFSLTQGKVVMLNQAAEDSTGYSLDELARTPVDAMYPPEERGRLAIAFERLRQTGYSSDKLRMYARNGELRDIWTRSYVVQHQPEAICLVHTLDVTEENRKRERELRNARLASLGQSSATLAHELKNALQSMQFSLGTLRTQMDEQSLTRAAGSLQRVERAVAHMDDVITGIEKAARNSVPAGGHVSLASAIENAVMLMSNYLEAKSVEVTTHFAEAIPPIWCDRTQLEQILIVLIKNAAQAMATRPVRKLHIALSHDPDRARIEVSDTGGGLAPEIEARIFEAFATTKPVGVGMGLGLSTAKQLAENQALDLTFRTRPGDGTTFAVDVPIERGLKETTEFGPLASKVVLVVGDDAGLLEPVASDLTQAGARVLVATSAQEASQLLRVHAVQALLCDDAMYPVSARAFVRTVRESYRGPVCLLADAHASREAPVVGMDFVIPKPVRPDTVIEVLRTLMD